MERDCFDVTRAGQSGDAVGDDASERERCLLDARECLGEGAHHGIRLTLRPLKVLGDLWVDAREAVRADGEGAGPCDVRRAKERRVSALALCASVDRRREETYAEDRSRADTSEHANSMVRSGAHCAADVPVALRDRRSDPVGNPGQSTRTTRSLENRCDCCEELTRPRRQRKELVGFFVHGDLAVKFG